MLAHAEPERGHGAEPEPRRDGLVVAQQELLVHLDDPEPRDEADVLDVPQHHVAHPLIGERPTDHAPQAMAVPPQCAGVLLERPHEPPCEPAWGGFGAQQRWGLRPEDPEHVAEQMLGRPQLRRGPSVTGGLRGARTGEEDVDLLRQLPVQRDRLRERVLRGGGDCEGAQRHASQGPTSHGVSVAQGLWAASTRPSSCPYRLSFRRAAARRCSTVARWRQPLGARAMHCS